MPAFLPVTIKGDANIHLGQMISIIRQMPQQVSPRIAGMICAMVPSERGYEEFVHVAAVPKIRKWVDDRAGGRVATIKQTVQNDTYEVSLGINGDDFDDDQIGAYTPIVQETMQSLLLAPDELVTTNLVAQGASITAFDGVAFYGTTHKWPGSAVSNQINTRSGAGTTAANVESDFYTALAAIQTWKDDKGRLRFDQSGFNDGSRPDMALIVHHAPALNQQMHTVFGVAANGEPFEIPLVYGSNTAATYRKSTAANKAIPLSDGYLSGNSWYLHYVGGVGEANKPFFFVDREPPRVTIFARGSEHYEKYNEVLILGKRRFGLGVNEPGRSQRLVNS